MRPARLAAALTAALAALHGCADDARAPFDLDSIDQPELDCVTVVHEALELGGELRRYVADGPNSAGGWALVETSSGGVDRIELVRVPASPDEPPLEPFDLGVASLTSTHVELRGGAAPGELWVLLDSGFSAILRKFAPGVGGVVGNGAIGNFPVPSSLGCPTEYSRQLLLIEGRPFVLALPDCSDSPALTLQLLELDPDDLQFLSSWSLAFDPCSDDPECANFAHTLGSIRRGESSQIADAERVAVGFSQVRQFSVDLTSTDVSLLELRLIAGDPSARLVTFRQVWTTPTKLGPVELAQDPFSVQLHVRNGGSDLDSALLRFDAIGELYIQIKTPQLLPFGGRGRLVQLATQSAMVDARDGALELVPLLDVAAWPIWEPRTVYELDDLVGFEPAGIGQLLLRREQAPAQLIALRCVE